MKILIAALIVALVYLTIMLIVDSVDPDCLDRALDKMDDEIKEMYYRGMGDE